jgi:hypothetical protein
MEQSNTTLEMVNGLSEIAEYMEDEELTSALTFIAKIIIKPDIPMSVATVEIVRLQARWHLGLHGWLMWISQIEERRIFTIQQQSQSIVSCLLLNT